MSSTEPSERLVNTDYHVHATEELLVPKAYAGPFRFREQAERAAAAYAERGWSVKIEAKDGAS